MIRRIKAGKRSSDENPSAQDLMEALKDGPRAAIAVYRTYTEKQYQNMKKMMDAFAPVLPPEVNATWKAIEAFHDMRRGN